MSPDVARVRSRSRSVRLVPGQLPVVRQIGTAPGGAVTEDAAKFRNVGELPEEILELLRSLSRCLFDSGSSAGLHTSLQQEREREREHQQLWSPK